LASSIIDRAGSEWVSTWEDVRVSFASLNAFSHLPVQTHLRLFCNRQLRGWRIVARFGIHKLAIIIVSPRKDHSCCLFWGGGASTMASKFACCGMQPFCINTVTVAQIFHRKLEELTLGPLQSILCLNTTVVQLKQCYTSYSN